MKKENIKFHFCGMSDKGLLRGNNEDLFEIKEDLNACIVVDGMGGEAAGEIASRTFIESSTKVLSKRLQPFSERALIKSLKQSFMLSNVNILKQVQECPSYKGMGCTADILFFYKKNYYIAHIGDSRVYRYRKGTLKQLTHDHSIVQDKIDKGLISSKEARNHPERNLINKAVGVKKEIEPDIINGFFLQNDLFLICTDGLTDMVDDDQIQNILSTGDFHIETKVKKLINAANKAGGEDNITVVLALSK